MELRHWLIIGCMVAFIAGVFAVILALAWVRMPQV